VGCPLEKIDCELIDRDPIPIIWFPTRLTFYLSEVSLGIWISEIDRQTTDIMYQSAILYDFLPSKHEEERLFNSYLCSMPS
jgi:hypothetical protein